MRNGNMAKRENKEGIRSAFNSHHICRADRGPGLGIHQEE